MGNSRPTRNKSDHSGTGVMASRRVTWSDVEGSCDEIFKFEVIHPDATAPLVAGSTASTEDPKESEPEQKEPLTLIDYLKFITPCGCYSGVRRLFDQPSRQAGYVTPAKGHLWKLNHDAENDMEDIRSWRRRLFFLRKCEQQTAFMYISEKDDGSVVLSCLLRGHGRESGDVCTEELDTVELPRISNADKNWAINNMHSYELAFTIDHGVTPLDEMDAQVPRMLYPISLSWEEPSGDGSSVDSEERYRKVVVAATSEVARKRWLNALKSDRTPRSRPGKKGSRQASFNM